MARAGALIWATEYFREGRHSSAAWIWNMYPELHAELEKLEAQYPKRKPQPAFTSDLDAMARTPEEPTPSRWRRFLTWASNKLWNNALDEYGRS